MPLETATEQPFGSLQRQMTKMMEQMNKGFFSFSPGEAWTPNVNLYETDTAYLVCVDLAGVEKDKIDLSVADQHLTLRGTRPAPLHPQLPPGESQLKYRVHLMEIDHGSFTRDVELPQDAEKDKIHATYRDGMLWIELPKCSR